MSEATKDRLGFWQDLIRVQGDKLMLFALLLFLLARHFPDGYVELIVGALLALMREQRYQWKPPSNKE